VLTPRQVSDVADGVNYLHSHSIIHGDLKGPSILVDATGCARLTDFEFAAVAPGFGSVGSITDGHALRWAAPEILDKERPVSMESDIYSFAMVVIEVFTGKAPFYGIPPNTVAVGVLSGNRPARPTHPSLTNNLWKMIERCWNQNLKKRPRISEVVFCLQTTFALRHCHGDVNDNQAPDDTTSERGLLPGVRSRPSRLAPVSSVLRRLYNLGGFSLASRSTSDAEPTHDAGSKEYDRRTGRRH